MKSLIINSNHLFEKLMHDYLHYKEDTASIFKALDVSFSAWHLTDWVFNEYEKGNYSGIGDMRNKFYEKCDKLKIISDLVIGYKHVTVSSPKSNLEDNNAAWINFLHDFSVNQKELKIKLKDEEAVPLEGILDEVVEFWKYYFEARYHENQNRQN